MTETTEKVETITGTKLDEQKIQRIINLLGALLCFIVAFALTFNPHWQLTILAGLLGGAFYLKLRRGALIGTIVVGLAWGLYILIKATKTNALELFNQFIGILLDNEALSWLFILVIILIGALLGALGGVLGSGIRMLIQTRLEKKNNSPEP